MAQEDKDLVIDDITIEVMEENTEVKEASNFKTTIGLHVKFVAKLTTQRKYVTIMQTRNIWEAPKFSPNRSLKP
ncbi:hypothetical protein Syun_000765 [Stephania yunnanensis]|uniref:Uncharacterized protein n=1 Tax=Stephania yunnanensis TaxID=152371 RepID=A0AAP0Q5V5_9MAGN